MRTVLVLVGKEWRLFWKDKAAVSLTFLVPAVLIYIFGHVFGLTRQSSGPAGIPLAVVKQTSSPVADAIIAALKKEKTFKVLATEERSGTPLTEEPVRAMLREGKIRFALLFPPDTEVQDGVGIRMRFLNNPRNEIETQTVTGLLQKTIFTAAPQAMLQVLQRQAQAAIGAAELDEFNRKIAHSVAEAFDGDPEKIYQAIKEGNLDALTQGNADDGSGAKNAFESIVTIESEVVGGRKVHSPQATRSVGGWAVMFLLFALSGAATSLFDEKKSGIFQRLLSMPVRRAQILWSKYIFGVQLGLVQLMALFAAGALLYRIDIVSNLGNLLLVCLAASLACVAFGMLLAAVSPTTAAASGLGTFLILTMSAVGGAWFPVSFMPEFIQHLSKLTIVYWAIEGFIQVLWTGATFTELLPTLSVLLGIAAVVTTISLWRFQRSQIFD